MYQELHCYFHSPSTHNDLNYVTATPTSHTHSHTHQLLELVHLLRHDSEAALVEPEPAQVGHLGDFVLKVAILEHTTRERGRGGGGGEGKLIQLGIEVPVWGLESKLKD